jgi:hypothetical protein
LTPEEEAFRRVVEMVTRAPRPCADCGEEVTGDRDVLTMVDGAVRYMHAGCYGAMVARVMEETERENGSRGGDPG